MSSPNPDNLLTLDDCVAEVLGILTGLDLQYDPQLDRYQAITRCINRALRSTSLEKEWSYYSSTESVGPAVAGESEIWLRNTVRPRMINDDSVRLVNADDRTVVWAYFLPRDAINKYTYRSGLWCSVVRNTLKFSRPFTSGEAGLDIQVPVMREPRMFRLPAQPEDPEAPHVEVPAAVRNMPVDFIYPDLIAMKAAYYYAQTDPVMQPRVQTLDAEYKDLMYQIVERDERNTDSPFMNDFHLGLQNGLNSGYSRIPHPLADERGL